MSSFSIMPIANKFINRDSTGSTFIDCAPTYTSAPIHLPALPSACTVVGTSSAASSVASGSPTAALLGSQLPVGASEGTSSIRLVRWETEGALSDSGGSLARLERESHLWQAQRVQETQESTQTHRSYYRHVSNYEVFWEQLQRERRAADHAWTNIPAFPVTATKVAHFLQHELSREKVSVYLHTSACVER